MEWIYNHTKITEVSQFPDNTFGFVYRIKHIPSDKAYICKKVLIHHRKSKLTKKTISTKEAEKIIEEHHKSHDHFKENKSQNPKKTAKLSKTSKKIRKK